MFDKELFEIEKTVNTVEDLKKFNDQFSVCFDISRKKFKVDLKKYLHLQHLRFIGDSKFRVGLSELVNLRQLILFGIHAKVDDLSTLVDLRHLTLTGGNITSLSFVSRYNDILSIELNNLNRLKDIHDLTCTASTLVSLEIDSCKKIEDLEKTLVELKNLEILKLNGFVLKDIDWLPQLPKLKQLIIMDSNILSGDIAPAKDIAYVAIDNRRHYNYRFDFETKKIMPKT